jgi:hypothetical protein
MLSDLPKKILILFISILIILLCIKFTIVTFQNTVLNIIKSEKFTDFIGKQIEFHIINYANNLNTKKDDDALKDSIKKILLKWKPVLEEINQEKK